MKVEVDVLGSPSLIIRTVSVDVKQHRRQNNRGQDLCESRDGRPGLPFLNRRYLWTYSNIEDKTTELKICVKEKVDVVGSPSLIVPMVSVDVRRH